MKALHPNPPTGKTLRKPIQAASLLLSFLAGKKTGLRVGRVCMPSCIGAAAVCLLGLFVEHLAGQAQVIALVYKCIQLLPSSQHALDCLHAIEGSVKLTA